mmetsp:Transcript_16974/g.26142  ORF Transcript_16974/g.26142 Transcript_16974/m.26142 type:complete len:90 (-) Transcript_16974:1540-1809(-)
MQAMNPTQQPAAEASTTPASETAPSTSAPAFEPSKTATSGGADGAPTFSLDTLLLQQMRSNVCEKHFPEPIIYVSEKPLCKKCLPEYLE